MFRGKRLRAGLRAGALALLLLIAPAARAQATDTAPPEGVRLRLGAGLISGGTLIGNLQFSNGIAALFGVDLRLGVQLNERLAVMYEGGATLLWVWIGNAVLVEVTPLEYLSVAVGGGVYWFALGGEGGGIVDSLSMGVPIRLAFNLSLIHI